MPNPSPTDLGALRHVAPTGIDQVLLDALKLGYAPGHPDWSNLGPGQPEDAALEGGAPRVTSLALELEGRHWRAPSGHPLLRERIAEHLNRTFRQGLASQYGPQNVVVGPGVRGSLARALAALDSVPVGFVCPDAAVFEALLEPHVGRITPVPLRTDPGDGFQLHLDALERAVRDAGLGAVLLSNPNNPTGTLVSGKRLERLVRVARDFGCTLLIDESYGAFTCDAEGAPHAAAPSAAAHVEDVERDPVLIFDGLSIGRRYPDWRLGWAVGPQALVEQLTRVGAARDGGASRLAQSAALGVLEESAWSAEYAAAGAHFARKRALMLKRLTEIGVRFPDTARGSFYLWGDLSGLPEPFDDAGTLYRKALQARVLTVPGAAFDVDPGRRRRGATPYGSWMRFSSGPTLDALRMGLDRLAKIVREG